MDKTIVFGGETLGSRPEDAPGKCTGCVGLDAGPVDGVSLCSHKDNSCADDHIIWVRKAAVSPATLPTDAAARKAAPIFSGCLSYFPLAMAEVARVSVTGNKQHALGQKLHFARDLSTDHGDCIIRHQMEFDKVDTDGHYHAAKVAWRALAQLQVLLETPK